jgi:hypothetical protein
MLVNFKEIVNHGFGTGYGQASGQEGANKK